METFSAEAEMCVFGIQTVAGAQPAAEPELHFKSQQAARSSAVSQFLRRAAGGRAAAPTQQTGGVYLGSIGRGRISRQTTGNVSEQPPQLQEDRTTLGCVEKTIKYPWVPK